jgi:hypothetical protein
MIRTFVVSEYLTDPSNISSPSFVNPLYCLIGTVLANWTLPFRRPERDHMSQSVKLRGAIAGVALAAMLAASAPANATLTLTATQGGSSTGENVIFNNCTGNVTQGLTVQGCLNSQPTNLINFKSSTELDASGGQAVITSLNSNGFNDVTISFANTSFGFSSLVFNIDALQDGTATFSAIDQFGTTFNFGSFNYSIDQNGSNWFELGSVDGQVATSFSIITTNPIADIGKLEQVRLGPTTVNTPEPASMAVLGVALVGFGMVRRWKKQT